MAEAVETFSAAKASGTTGGTCPTSGPYRSSRNSQIVLFVLAGTKFPTDSDGSNTNWSLVSDAATSRDPAAE